MEKNKNFDIPDIPKGNVDTITTKIIKSQERVTQDVINGELDYSHDPPPADLLPEVKSTNKDRYREFAVADSPVLLHEPRGSRRSTTRRCARRPTSRSTSAPLRRHLRRAAGAHVQLHTVRACRATRSSIPARGATPTPPPDLEKAKQLIEESGEKGAEVTVWGNTDNPTPKTTEYYADVLNEIGLKAKPKIIDAGVYFSTIGNAKTKAQTGYAGWFQDFPHPANFFQIVTKIGIQPTNATNYGNVDIPEVTGAYEKLKQEEDLESVAGDWAAADKDLVEGTGIVPFGTAKEVGARLRSG